VEVMIQIHHYGIYNKRCVTIVIALKIIQLLLNMICQCHACFALLLYFTNYCHINSIASTYQHTVTKICIVCWHQTSNGAVYTLTVLNQTE